MQTFLPYASFRRSARVLDDRRLGKQRVEVIQILNTLTGKRLGWRNHPAVAMWRGHEEALVEYGLEVTREWLRRGHRDTCYDKIAAFTSEVASARRPPGQRPPRPPWLGERAFHRSHRSALVRKDPERYRPLFPGVPDDLPYIWPGRAQPSRR